MTLSQWWASDVTGAKTAASVAVVVAVALYAVLIAVGGRSAGSRTVRNTDAHGSARLASQEEALEAARGDRNASPLHDQTFKD